MRLMPISSMAKPRRRRGPSDLADGLQTLATTGYLENRNGGF